MNVFVKAALVTTFVFATGLVFGLWIGAERVSEVEKTISQLDDSIKNAEMQFMIFDAVGEEVTCKYLEREAALLGWQADELGKEVEMIESSRKLEESPFWKMKHRYTSLLIRNWLMLERIRKTCDGEYITLLYFYSNKECDGCFEQGVALSYVKEKMEGQLMVFALDGDMNLEVLHLLKDIYNIDSYPTIVVDNEVHEGFVSVEQLKLILCDFNGFEGIC